MPTPTPQRDPKRIVQVLGSSRKRVDQGGAAARPWQELDRADQPLERSLGVLAQNSHPPGLDPFVGILLADFGHAGFAALGERSNAAAGLVAGLVSHRRKAERAVKAIGVGDQRPELPRR